MSVTEVVVVTPGRRRRDPRRAAAAVAVAAGLVLAGLGAAAGATPGGTTPATEPAGRSTGGAADPSGTAAAVPSGTASTRGATSGSPGAAGSGAAGRVLASPSDVVLDDAVAADWDGPTLHLDWTGAGYTTAEATFVGDRVVAPGDRVQRTLRVRNDGPEAAVLTVSMLLDPQVPAEALNPRLAEAVHLFWDVAGETGSATYAALAGGGDQDAVVAQAAVPRGGTARVAVGFTVPPETTEHRGRGRDSTVLAFTVRARMQGETAPAAEERDADAPAGPGAAGPAGEPAGPAAATGRADRPASPGVSWLPRTGAAPLAAAGAALVLVGAGCWLLAARRPDGSEEDQVVVRVPVPPPGAGPGATG